MSSETRYWRKGGGKDTSEGKTRKKILRKREGTGSCKGSNVENSFWMRQTTE
jgi:hypothetical protein